MIIFDLDGVLADPTHRLPFIQRHVADRDWQKFHDGVVEDPALAWGVTLFTAVSARGIGAAICTNRPATHRRQTVEWLGKFDLRYDYLLMRAPSDNRPHEVVKQGMLEMLQAEGTVELAIDDHPKVIEMYRKLKVPCLAAFFDASAWVEEEYLSEHERAGIRMG